MIGPPLTPVSHRPHRFLAVLVLGLLAGPADVKAGLKSGDGEPEPALKVVHRPMRSDGPKSMDPVRGSTTYDNQAISQIYDTLLQYKYLARPPQLEPCLIEEMPTLSDDELTYRFKLKKGIRFQDDPCFPGGKGRELVSQDVFYSWKRMSDNDNQPKSWWLYEDTIAGLDAYRKVQNEAATFDYDAPVEGMRVINDHEFEVILVKPVQRFLWVLAMFQSCVVPREAVEKYGTRFGRHPVGTGPFSMAEEDWVAGQKMILKRNPTYREDFYPSEHEASDEALGLHLPAGKRLPLVDRVEITMFVQDQPMWLQFRAGKLDYTQVPSEYFPKAFLRRSQSLKQSFRDEGIVAHAVPLLDFIFRAFNMEDPIVGGYTGNKRALREAMHAAVDLYEFNDTFYNGLNWVYDGPIPPGLAGFPENGIAPNSLQGPDLKRARALLAKAGYPEGKGLPVIEYYTSNGSNIAEQVELFRRQLGKIGVRLLPRLLDFSTLIDAISNKRAQMFSFAWGSDYPDAENNLALFYGPNHAPGSNHYNYQNDEYDKLYQKIAVMPPGPERTEILVKMRDMVMRDVPYIGSMARTRHYLINPWLRNFKPSEDFYNWIKYMDIDESKRPNK